MEKKSNPDDQRSVLDLVKAQASESSLSGKNRAVIVDLKDEIADVLARGYTWKTIWEALSRAERIHMSYATFRMHCRAEGLETAPQSYIGPTGPRRANKDDEQP